MGSTPLPRTKYMEHIKVEIEVPVSNTESIVIAGDRIDFKVETIRPKHVKLAAEIGPHVRSIVSLIRAYKEKEIKPEGGDKSAELS